eukprot:991612_1
MLQADQGFFSKSKSKLKSMYNSVEEKVVGKNRGSAMFICHILTFLVVSVFLFFFCWNKFTALAGPIITMERVVHLRDDFTISASAKFDHLLLIMQSGGVGFKVTAKQPSSIFCVWPLCSPQLISTHIDSIHPVATRWRPFAPIAYNPEGIVRVKVVADRGSLVRQRKKFKFRLTDPCHLYRANMVRAERRKGGGTLMHAAEFALDTYVAAEFVIDGPIPVDMKIAVQTTHNVTMSSFVEYKRSYAWFFTDITCRATSNHSSVLLPDEVHFVLFKDSLAKPSPHPDAQVNRVILYFHSFEDPGHIPPVVRVEMFEKSPYTHTMLSMVPSPSYDSGENVIIKRKKSDDAKSGAKSATNSDANESENDDDTDSPPIADSPASSNHQPESEPEDKKKTEIAPPAPQKEEVFKFQKPKDSDTDSEEDDSQSQPNSNSQDKPSVVVLHSVEKHHTEHHTDHHTEHHHHHHHHHKVEPKKSDIFPLTKDTVILLSCIAGVLLFFLSLIIYC